MGSLSTLAKRALRRLRKAVFQATAPKKLADVYVEAGFHHEHGWPNSFAATSADLFPDKPPAFHHNVMLSGVPLDRFLRAAVMPGKPSRVTTLQEYLNTSVTTPEVLSGFLTDGECDVIAQLEALKDDIHHKAEHSEALVSVIMPTRNVLDAQFEAAISSVLHQTHTALELLILDHGGHLDPTDPRLSSDPRIRVVPVGHLSGLGAVRQEGLRQSAGDFIAWLDDDDLWDRRHLTISLDQIRSRGLVAFYSATLATSGPVGPSGVGSRFECIRWTPFRRSLLENRNFIGTPTLVHKNLGPEAISISLNRFTDWLTACQLADLGPIGSLPIILSAYNTKSRSHFVSTTRGTAGALADFRHWQQTRRTPHPDDVPFFVPRYETHNDKPQPDVAVSVVVLSREPSDFITRCLRSLNRAPLTAQVVDVVVVDATGSETHNRQLQAAAGDFHDTPTVVTSSYGDAWALAQAGRAALRGDSDAVVVIDDRAEFVNGSLDLLVRALLSDNNSSVMVPEVLVSPGNKAFSRHLDGQHGDAAGDIMFSPVAANGYVAEVRRPDETLQVISGGPADGVCWAERGNVEGRPPGTCGYVTGVSVLFQGSQRVEKP